MEHNKKGDLGRVSSQMSKKREKLNDKEKESQSLKYKTIHRMYYLCSMIEDFSPTQWSKSENLIFIKNK